MFYNDLINDIQSHSKVEEVGNKSGIIFLIVYCFRFQSTTYPSDQTFYFFEISVYDATYQVANWVFCIALDIINV